MLNIFAFLKFEVAFFYFRVGNTVLEGYRQLVFKGLLLGEYTHFGVEKSSKFWEGINYPFHQQSLRLFTIAIQSWEFTHVVDLGWQKKKIKNEGEGHVWRQKGDLNSRSIDINIVS